MQIQTLLQTLWPIRCTLCDLPSDNHKPICDDCRSSLPYRTSSCIQCGLISDNNTICTTCIAQPPVFDRTIALFNYTAPISTLITHYKFNGDLRIASVLASEWIDFLEKHATVLPEMIIPVPLHSTRLKARGFNQALFIAKPIGKHFKIPVDTKTCIRLKNTDAQSHLSASKRKGNVKNAFALSRTLSANRIAILDDVMTTGSTVSEISGLLKKAGAAHIEIWCCARAQ